MKLGIIGRGRWGNVYAKTLSKMGIEYRQMGRDWDSKGVDGMIIASSYDTHFMIAKGLLLGRMPCIIEKPITMSFRQANKLLRWAEMDYKSIVFVGHTRLYSPAWREFKANLPEIRSVRAEMGRICKGKPQYEIGPHLISMCKDIGWLPEKALLKIHAYDVPLKFIINEGFDDEMVFDDPMTDPTPLEVLITEFVEAIKSGKQNINSLRAGVEVMAYCGA